MNDIYYYIIIGILLYVILTRVLDNYGNTNEIFDPSLVPVSSIVLLSKLTEKLSKSNEVISYPNKIQLGSSTPSNLVVNGTSNFNDVNIRQLNMLTDVTTSNITITGDTTINKLIVPKLLTVTKDAKTNTLKADKLSISDKITINNGTVTGDTTTDSLLVNGDTDNTGELKVIGNTKIDDAIIKGTLTNNNFITETLGEKNAIFSTDINNPTLLATIIKPCSFNLQLIANTINLYDLYKVDGYIFLNEDNKLSVIYSFEFQSQYSTLRFGATDSSKNGIRYVNLGSSTISTYDNISSISKLQQSFTYRQLVKESIYLIITGNATNAIKLSVINLNYYDRINSAISWRLTIEYI